MTNPVSLEDLTAEQLQAVLDYLKSLVNGEGGDLSTELADLGLTQEQAAYCLADVVNDVNNNAVQQGGPQVAQLPAYTPPAHGADASVYEASIEQYQTNITEIYNIDNSEDIIQNINNFGGTVNAQIADDGGVNVGPESSVDGVINTGSITDSNVATASEGSTVTQTGDVTASDGSAVNTGPGGNAETTGSGTDFGEGSQGNVQAASDNTGPVNQQSNQNQQDIDITGGAGGGNASTDATGGAGGAGGAEGAGGEGGDATAGTATGGEDSDSVDIDNSPIGNVNQSNEAPDFDGIP